MMGAEYKNGCTLPAVKHEFRVLNMPLQHVHGVMQPLYFNLGKQKKPKVGPH